MGAATAGAMIEAGVEDFPGVEKEVEAGSATMLDCVATDVEAPPPELVRTDVTRTTEVREETAFAVLGESVEEEEVDVTVVVGKVREDPETEFVVALSAEDEEPELFTTTTDGLAEGESVAEGEESVEDDGEGEGPGELALPPEEEEETAWRFWISKRSFEVAQQPLLESPSASGRLASQQNPSPQSRIASAPAAVFPKNCKPLMPPIVSTGKVYPLCRSEGIRSIPSPDRCKCIGRGISRWPDSKGRCPGTTSPVGNTLLHRQSRKVDHRLSRGRHWGNSMMRPT